MHGVRRITSIGLAVVAALATTIAPTSAATSTTRWVDNDGHAGPNGCGGSATAAKKIQKAVDNSNQADVIIVCPGTYVEQVTIKGNRDGLTLRSSTPFGATIKTPRSLDGSQGFTYIVGVIKTNGVTVEGFKTITRTQAPCTFVSAAIAAIASRRFVVRGNRVLAPGSDTGTCFQGYGIAIQDSFSEELSRASSASFTSNEVRDAVQGAFGAFAFLRTVTATIAGNSARAYFGAPPSGTTALSARQALAGRRTLAAPVPLGGFVGSSFGVLLAGKVKGTVTGNVIQGSSEGPLGGPAFSVGIAVLGSNGAPSNSNGPIDIRSNLIRRVSQAVVLVEADEVTARLNTINNVLDGVRVMAGQGDIVRRNSVSSRSTGITLDAASTGNAIRDNTFSGNGGTCADDSSGGGSHGTANTWTGNTATVHDDPNGICPTP